MGSIFNNRRGISAIVTTIILVALVLVVVGIFWGTVRNIVNTQTEKAEVSQKCIGLIYDIDSVSCDGSTCSLGISRGSGSSGDAIDGVDVVVGDGTSEATGERAGDIAVSATIDVSTDITATEASLRIYFLDDAGEKQYCNQISSYP